MPGAGSSLDKNANKMESLKLTGQYSAQQAASRRSACAPSPWG